MRIRDLARAALGVVVVGSWSGATNAKDTRGGMSTSLPDLPLADRCAVALMIAKEVRETAEVIRPASDAIGTGRLRLLISQSPEGSPPVSIFAPGETCEKHRMPLSWTPGKYVDLDLATGDVRSLPADPYVLVSTKQGTGSSWELTWRVDERYRSCPAVRGAAPCNEGAPRPPAREMPTLRLKVGWHGRGKDRELEVLDAVIEIARFS
jgi:hypothetical protein